MLKFTYLIKISLVLKISLKNLHLEIHKWESNKRSLVASVYFSLNIDVVFAIFQSQGTSLLNHLAVGLSFCVPVHLVISGGDHSDFLVSFSVLAVETLGLPQLRSLLLSSSLIINLIGMYIKKRTS